MKKSKIILVAIVLLAAVGAAMATKARSFIGYINMGGVYSPVWVPFDCPQAGWGCVYTSNNMTYQIYTLSGIWFNPVRP
ncbi:DUF6520 family protein [Chitinophaga filiformis]|uniref:DUF6520 family protein n=1 Tax=Chitinophaga filiformis TaxID=104663 RepID=A0ABY4HZR6_CHIFI|nr:DUF6520 family protein [Chitinophaga filiformis]UPK67991.1 DUF6520 family protein [Chitinophaga filiformis]